MRRLLTLVSGAALLALLTTTVLTSTVDARVDPSTAVVLATDGERHCIGQAQPSGSAPQPVTAVCFPTFSAAIAAATGGAVMLAPDAQPTDLTPASFDRTLGQTVIGLDYVDENFTGNTFTWYVDNDWGCAGGWTYENQFPPSGWNDVVSSASAWGGCNVFTHYEHVQFGGAYIECPPCSTMGAMNNATSSERWR